jgi:hypothetical protein
VAGQKFDEMLSNADWSHAGAATAVRDAEGFVQIEVANVRAHVGGTAETDLRVEIRAIHIDLAAVGVDDFANFFDGFFEDAVR